MIGSSPSGRFSIMALPALSGGSLEKCHGFLTKLNDCQQASEPVVPVFFLMVFKVVKQNSLYFIDKLTNCRYI